MGRAANQSALSASHSLSRVQSIDLARRAIKVTTPLDVLVEQDLERMRPLLISPTSSGQGLAVGLYSGAAADATANPLEGGTNR
jgi:hypothetical protein